MASILIDMVARQALDYDGRQIAAGEVFQAKPIDAAAMKYQHKAAFAPPPHPLRTKVETVEMLEPEPDFVRARERGPVPGGEAPYPAQQDWSMSDVQPQPVRRRYRRRDMVAEDL